jgi:hypothetical protein
VSVAGLLAALSGQTAALAARPPAAATGTGEHRQDSGSLAREEARRQRAADARLAQERVQGFLETALARSRASSGLIDPAWRDLERGIEQRFHPSAALVERGTPSMTPVQRVRRHIESEAAQILSSPQHVAPDPPWRGKFAQRGPAGVPEDSYRNALSFEQSNAVLSAWQRPAVWRRTEVELIVEKDGRVPPTRVVGTSGSHALDLRAADAVEQEARRHRAAYAGRRTVTRWAIDSAYVANPPERLGFRFDETGHIPGARGLGRYLTQPLYLVGSNLRARVSLVSLQEDRGSKQTSAAQAGR